MNKLKTDSKFLMPKHFFQLICSHIVLHRITCLVIGLIGMKALSLQAAQLFSQGALELQKPMTALERFQEFRLGGLSAEDRSFYISGSKKFLEKRELLSGGLIWEAKLESPSQSLWTTDRGQVFGGDTNGNLYSFDSQTGRRLWKSSTKGVFFAQPLVKGEKLWVMNSLGTLQAYDRTNGNWLWQQADPSIVSMSLWSPVAPVMYENLVISGFPSALLQAFDADTGLLVWKESFSSLAQGSMNINDIKSIALYQNYLFVSSFGGVLKVFNLKDKNRKLKFEKSISLYAPVSFDSAGVFYCSSKSGTVTALDIETGFEKWSFQLPKGLPTQVSVLNDLIWFGSSQGEIYVLNKSGNLLAKSEDFEAPIWNPPFLISNETALVLTSQGILRRLHYQN